MDAPGTKQGVTSARLLVEQLRVQGVERIFCVPGESFLAVLDALVDYPEIKVVTCRHEGGAAMMAEAYGKLTGRPGIVFATRGPGATNASSGVHVAHQDSTPLILFIGQIERAATGRGAFQEIDYRAMFSSTAKWATEIEDGRRVPEVVSRAFQLATSGRAGPVVIALPEDMLTEAVEPSPSRRSAAIEPRFAPEDCAAIVRAISASERPLLVVGGGGWSAETAQHAAGFAGRWELPVIASFRCQDYLDNEHQSYVGNLGLGANPALLAAVRQSDLILAVGARLGEVSSNGYTLLRIPEPEQGFVHVHPEPGEIGRVYQPTLGIVAGPRSTFRRLAETEPPAARPWAGRTRELKAEYERWTTPPTVPGAVQLGQVMSYLRDRLPQDAIITNGAGNFAIWPNRFHRYRTYRSMLAPMSGSMGYGVPAAIAAKIQHPDRLVVAFAGDGDFLMTGQELATAAKEEAPVIVVLLNNNMYGTIRMHQERTYPRRVSATALVNPDFIRLAEAYGAFAERITQTDQFPAAFDRAVASQRIALLEIVVDPEVISPSETITSLRGKGDKA